LQVNSKAKFYIDGTPSRVDLQHRNTRTKEGNTEDEAGVETSDRIRGHSISNE